MTDEEEGLFETVGRAADKIGETSMGKRIGAIFTIILLAALSGGANFTVIKEYFNGEDIGPIGGCKDSTATNYNSAATFEDGSCTFLIVIYGCTNSEAENYDSNATHDDGRCVILNGGNETIYGCMDSAALNYNDRAEEDDDSCEYEETNETCTPTEVYFWSVLHNVTDQDPLNITLDIDSDCGDESIETYVWYDVKRFEENETGDREYMESYTKDYHFNVTGWDVDEHNMTYSFEDVNETYGNYEIDISLLADFGEGYDFYDFFETDIIWRE